MNLKQNVNAIVTQPWIAHHDNAPYHTPLTAAEVLANFKVGIHSQAPHHKVIYLYIYCTSGSRKNLRAKISREPMKIGKNVGWGV